MRQVKLRLWIDIQALMMNVPDNADDHEPFDFLRIRIAEVDPFSDCIFARPVFFGHRLIDNHNPGRVRVVGLGKEATAQERRL